MRLVIFEWKQFQFKMCPYRWILTLVLFRVNNIEVYGNALAPCELLTADEDLQWAADVTNKTLTLSFRNQTMCYNDTCLPQVTALSVQQGSSVNISYVSNATIDVYRATCEDLDSCNFSSINHSSLMSSNITLTSNYLVLPAHLLYPGNNIFICSGGHSRGDSSVNCILNITVKTSTCSTNTRGVLCGGRGFCTATIHESSFSCKCCQGFDGDTCQTTLNLCKRDSCINGGTCNEPNLAVNITDTNSNQISPSFSCICPLHVTGSRCEVILTHCKSSPCVHGVCEERISGFQCYCVPGFHGFRCELEYNECLSNPCSNKGRCIDRLDLYECVCTNGYTGTLCETKKDLCSPNPCAANVSCIDLGDSVHCACPTGNSATADVECDQQPGDHQQPGDQQSRDHQQPVLNDCWSNPCHNHGTCEPLHEGYKCECSITFAGPHCEYMLDVFAPPMENSDFSGGEVHKHNLYIVAGTLGTMVLIVVSVMVACYCKIYETYKHLMWKRLRCHRKRSNSCPDLESVSHTSHFRKPRLSVDGLLEATSLFHENAAYDSHSVNTATMSHTDTI